jgi:hypothetical protein
MKQYSRKSLHGKLDKLVGEYFRARPCDYHKNGGCAGRIEWCHIKSRKYLSVRWLPINAFSLCSGRHFYFTNNPDEFTRWIDMNYPGRLEELQKLFITNVGTLKSWWFESLYEKLKSQLLGAEL